ncbi:helix-turn-helix domain-containing protein [Luteolibacter sp. LG18]|uniref:helix-turn-helix domain-containing protein n=1 Tax=Luteolibacter sp. LG18 TaxID=2819286 RepID=UPI0030C690C0
MKDILLHHPTPDRPAPTQTLCTRREAAARLRLSPRQLSNLVLAGEIPVVRLGAALRFRTADLEAFIEASTARVVKPQPGGAH